MHFYRLQKYNFSWFQQNNFAKQSKKCFFTSEKGTAASSPRTRIRQDSLITRTTHKHCRRAEEISARRHFFYFAISGNVCIFAPTFESESCKQEKHCDKVPFTEFAKIQTGGRAFVLSLDAYAWYAGTLPADGSIPSGVRYVP